MVIIIFIVNFINNPSFKFNIAMPLYMIFKSVSYFSEKKNAESNTKQYKGVPFK